jgi:hypothetical protein
MGGLQAFVRASTVTECANLVVQVQEHMQGCPQEHVRLRKSASAVCCAFHKPNAGELHSVVCRAECRTLLALMRSVVTMAMRSSAPGFTEPWA